MRRGILSRRPCEFNPRFRAHTGTRALPNRIRGILRQLARASRALRSRDILVEAGIGKACKSWTLARMVTRGYVARTGIPGCYRFEITPAGHRILGRWEGSDHV